ncbi:hypothetical protein ACET3Z_013094 [Daucus carota]
MCKCRSHGTFPLFGLQSSHLNICYYHQDPHQRTLRPGLRLRFRSDRSALLLIGAWNLPRRPGIGRALKRHPFSGLVDSAGIVHHLSGPDRNAHTRTLLRRSRSVGGAPHRGIPIRFPPDNFKHSLTLFSKSFSSFPRGTCLLSVSRLYLALDGIYRPIGAAFPNNPTRRQRLVVQQGPGTTGLSPSLATPSRGLGPGSVDFFRRRKQQTAHVAAIRTLHRTIQSVGATGGVYKGQGRSQRELMTRAY